MGSRKLYVSIIIVLLSTSFIMAFLPDLVHGEPDWLAGWSYRKSHQIMGSTAGAQTDYQVRIEVHYGSGTDSGEDVYLNSHCRTDFGDIRFTDADETTALDYWIEDATAGTEATFWVKIPNIPASPGSTTIYIYYGNSGATTTSVGETTFPDLFDDFDDWFPKETLGGAWGTTIKVDSTYHIFYVKWIGDDFKEIHRATSTDLIGWSDQGAVSPFSNHDRPAILHGIEDGASAVTYGGKYWMIVGNRADETKLELYSSTSITGSWTKEKDALTAGSPGEWDDVRPSTCWFFKDESTYYIYYQGKKTSDSKWRIGYATCSTPNGTWTKAGNNPRLEPGDYSWELDMEVDPVILKEGDTYYMFYTGVTGAGTNCINSYATSSSLSGTWAKSGVQITAQGISYPCVVKHTDNLYYLHGDDTTTHGSPPKYPQKYVFRSTIITGPYQTKWNKGGTPTASNSELLINADGEYVQSKSAFLYKAFRARIKMAALGQDNEWQQFGFSNNTAISVWHTERYIGYDTPDFRVYSGNATDWTRTDIYNSAYFGAYKTYSILWKETEAKFYIDDSLQATQTTSIDNKRTAVTIWDYKTSADLYVDWVLVRKYVDPEPSHGSWGSACMYAVETATGSGTATFETDVGTIQDLAAVDEATLPTEGKPTAIFPHGFFRFKVVGLTPGQTVTITVTLPSAVPVGTLWHKHHISVGWISLPIGSDDGDNVITVSITDGGTGDFDPAAGAILDPAGPGSPLPSPPVGIAAKYDLDDVTKENDPTIGTEFTTAMYGAIASSDDLYAVTRVLHTYDYSQQIFRFDVAPGVTEFTVAWEGNIAFKEAFLGGPGPHYEGIDIWNRATGSWEYLGNVSQVGDFFSIPGPTPGPSVQGRLPFMAPDEVISKTYKTNVNNYITGGYVYIMVWAKNSHDATICTDHVSIGTPTPPVGGVWVPINKFELLAPWIGLASFLMVSTVAVSVVYVKHRKKQQT